MSAIQRWRAPREDGAILADPPLARAGSLLTENRRRLLDGPEILGRSLAALREQAGREIRQAAVNYLAGAGEPIPPLAGPSLVLAGHQPELFHPGVWVKNFALQGIARAYGCTPLNLVVDNDTAKSTGLRLPTRAAFPATESECDPSVGLRAEPFDRWTGEVPYEELWAQDEALFAGFAARVGEILACWDFQPLLARFWEEACRQAGRTPLLGERFAAARRWLERRWDCHNLELPIGALCRTESFSWFACHLLSRQVHFHEVYNTAVRDYRERYGIRSRNHPVPDLAVEDDWREMPFWGWRSGQARRGRVFARLSGEQIDLRVDKEAWPSLPSSHAVAAWRSLEERGLKVRCRALTTTLFARLFLGDLFLHGIGGAKYDELTDDIIRRFYGLEPPAFLMLSATLNLPLPAFPIRPEQVRKMTHRLRDLHYNPQRHLAPTLTGEVNDLLREKTQWIARRPAQSIGRKERFHALRSINERLVPQVAERERDLRREIACKQRQQDANAILQRRDFAFCLFPEEKLRPFCKRFLLSKE